MLCGDSATKKLNGAAGPKGPARSNHRGLTKSMLNPSWSNGVGSALLEQLWSVEGSRGVDVHSRSSVSVLGGRAFFLPPKEWTRMYLPYRVITEGGVTITVALQRAGLLAGLSVTRSGQLRLNVWNATDEVIHLTPRTAMVNVFAEDIQIRFFGRKLRCASVTPEIESFAARLQQKVMTMFPKVGDLSSHPVNAQMAKLKVTPSEVVWKSPPERGVRTQYGIQNVADRRLINQQLCEYVQREYLQEASVADDLYLSPLLPVRKPNGAFRFTNDFRKLNKYFPSCGMTTQVDAWRRMWDLKPEWKFFMEIDLKDGFFSIPIHEDLTWLFGFTYGDRRFFWLRLPQGWKWSSVLFCERIAEILKGMTCPQYSDNVLVGAVTLEELEETAIEVFRRFDTYGIKVNFDKVRWVSTSITFLGFEIRDGKWSFESYLKKRMDELGEVRSIKGLERIIGVLSYIRRAVLNMERILGPLRADLKTLKNGSVTSDWWDKLNTKIRDAFRQALENLHWLVLPGVDSDSFTFRMETDWANGVSGYMLFACRGNEERLVDIGSRVSPKGASSYLGELDSMIWACQRTKAYRGSIPLIIKTDGHSLIDKAKSGNIYDKDIRIVRRWGWLLANEPGFQIQFIPGSENRGADLLSRPVKSNGECSQDFLTVPGQSVKDDAPLVSNSVQNQSDDDWVLRRIVWKEHLRAHWGPWKVYHALRDRGLTITFDLVRHVCSTCDVCAMFRDRRRRLHWGQPPFSLEPGHTVYADVVGPTTPGRGGFRFIHCLIDSATRLVAASCMRVPNSQTVIKSLERWVRDHGCINVIVTDNATYYDSDLLRAWCREHGVKQIKIAPYMHQSNGLVERMNRTIVDRIRKLCYAEGGSWTEYVARAVDAINNAVHSVTGFSPAALWNGSTEMRKLAHRRVVCERERKNLRQQVYPELFEAGQLVLVYDHVAASSREKKFAPRWKGPYVLTERISPSLWKARKVALSGYNRGRQPMDVFHEDQLQSFEI